MFKSIKRYFAKGKLLAEDEKLHKMGRVVKTQNDVIDSDISIRNIAYADGSHSAIIFNHETYEIYNITHISSINHSDLQIV